MARMRVVAVSGSTLVLSVALPLVVSAATSEEIAQSLLDQASQTLGIEITDPNLVEELSDGLEYAIEDSSIPEEIVDEISDDTDSGTDSDDLDQTIDSNLNEQLANWDETATSRGAVERRRGRSL